MIGIILAAGVGSRLRPLTSTKPKSLIKVAGKSLLDYQINAYRVAGIKEVIIVVGYEGLLIKQFCKSIKDIKIHIVENNDYESTNNMYSLFLTKDIVNNRGFILNNADLCIETDIIKKLVASDEVDAIAVDSSIYNDESMKIEINEAGNICNISKQVTKNKSHACSIDIYKFSPKSSFIFFNEISNIILKEKNLKDWTEVAMQRLFKNQTLLSKPVHINGMKWVEVDNYEDLARADIIFSKFDELKFNFDTFFFDLDGTIYLGESTIPGAKEVIKKLANQNKNIYYLSNNTSKGKREFVDKLNNMGIPCKEEQVLLPYIPLIEFLKNIKCSDVYIVGTESLKKNFIEHNINPESKKPEYVIIGYDTELNYEKLKIASEYIYHGAQVIATHTDKYCPTENGPIPDAGAIIELFYQTTGVRPEKIFGKPSPNMIPSTLMRELIDKKRNVLLVGDRLHTDILMAKNCNFTSALVLTGETSRDHLEETNTSPDFILTSIGDLL